MKVRANHISKQNIGQLLIIGFDGTEMTPRLTSLLTRLQPAGVILFARNIKTPEQTMASPARLPEVRLHAALYLRRPRRRPGRSLPRRSRPQPSAAEVFATGDRKLFRKHGQLIGENCRALGFNLDFAPVLDLAFEASRSVMSSRAVSANPRETVTYAREFLAGLRSRQRAGMRQAFPRSRRRHTRQPSRSSGNREGAEKTSR